MNKNAVLGRVLLYWPFAVIAGVMLYTYNLQQFLALGAIALAFLVVWFSISYGLMLIHQSKNNS